MNSAIFSVYWQSELLFHEANRLPSYAEDRVCRRPLRLDPKNQRVQPAKYRLSLGRSNEKILLGHGYPW